MDVLLGCRDGVEKNIFCFNSGLDSGCNGYRV